MITVRRNEERGSANFGWLNSRHTFSFGHYFDQKHMGHGPLRVINEDRVKPGHGFDTHGHSNMEIISWVLDGALNHEDSMGNGSIIRPGDMQRMTAGTGVRHSEYNASDEEEVHFLQIWILPEAQGLDPDYEQKNYSREDKLNRFLLVGSRGGRDGSVHINRDVDLYASVLEPGREITHGIASGRKGWVQVARGRVAVNGEVLAQGDGLATDGPIELQVAGLDDSEILVFDMA